MAYFLGRSGDKMEKLKLMKLLYLSERAYLLKYHDTLTGERLVSLAYGPVLSDTLNLINGINDSEDGGYLGQYFKLSPNRRSSELVDYTHKNCHEWQDPQGSSVPIKYEDIFAKDYSEQEAHEIADAIREQEQLSEIIR